MAWFIWLGGDGPLLQTEDGALALVYDVDGACAYRVGGVERVTVVPSQAAKERWIYVAVAKRKQDVVFQFNDGVLDRWEDAPVVHSPLSNLLVMRDAVGFAADIAIFPRALTADVLERLWHGGKHRV